MRFRISGLALAAALLWILPVSAQTPPEQSQPAPKKEIISVTGKLYCVLKRDLLLNYEGRVKSAATEIGQKVAKDEILARFDISPDIRIQQRQALSLYALSDLEYKIASTQNSIRKLQDKKADLQVMLSRDLATTQAIEQNEKELNLLNQSLSLLQSQVAMEKERVQDVLERSRLHFGKGLKLNTTPHEQVILSPIDGHILWVNAELREGIKMPAGSRLYQVGIMDPLLVKTSIHEIETQKLQKGDVGLMEFDSLPGQKFTVTVSNVPLTPTPSAIGQPSYYEVELKLANPDLRLREGLKGTVKIEK